jgi:hypothetical protein
MPGMGGDKRGREPRYQARNARANVEDRTGEVGPVPAEGNADARAGYGRAKENGRDEGPGPASTQARDRVPETHLG